MLTSKYCFRTYDTKKRQYLKESEYNDEIFPKYKLKQRSKKHGTK